MKKHLLFVLRAVSGLKIRLETFEQGGVHAAPRRQQDQLVVGFLVTVRALGRKAVPGQHAALEFPAQFMKRRAVPLLDKSGTLYGFVPRGTF